MITSLISLLVLGALAYFYYKSTISYTKVNGELLRAYTYRKEADSWTITKQ